MRKKIIVLLLTLVSAVCLVLGVTACGSSSSGSSESGGTEQGSNESTTKQTPIYQGMVISTAETSSNTATATAAALSADNFADGGNYGGNYGYDNDYEYYHHYHGDYEGKDNDIDYDQPYGDDTPTIEQEISTTLQVTGAGQSIYYADKGENIYITIKLLNPDYYDIISFVLTYGVTEIHYSSYMFETGSDYENIIIQLNVGETGGIIDYTISQIKYIDGTSIKDVLMNGDTVVKCGVRADDQTYASVTDETHDLNSISFSVKIVDLYSLIDYSDGYVKALLYDGESIVQTVDLTVGNNQVVFSGLSPNTLYQYAVVGLYDNLSGNGTALNYLYTNALYTDTIVLFNDITVGQESISFGYSWYEGYSAATITGLTLTRGNKAQTLDSAATSATGLLSNTEYVLTASYLNLENQTESISITFTTLTKSMPTVEIETLSSTQSSVNYAFTISDTDSVGSLTSVTLTLGDSTVETLTEAEGTFTSLLSNNAYTLTAVYTYNLNDGNGDQKIEVELNINTKSKATPTVELVTFTSDQSAVDYELAITDKDSVGSLTSVTLMQGVNFVGTLDEAEGTFSGLLSNNTYTLTAVYTYDLNDGKGEQEITIIKRTNTKAKVQPGVAIEFISSNTTGLTFDITFTDKDSVGEITAIGLYNGDTLVKEVTDLTQTTLEFTELDAYIQYTLKVDYQYDLNDGTGTKTGSESLSVYTNPVIEFEELSVRNTSAVSEGETIYIQATMNNPNKATFTSVVVNNQTYSVSSVSSTTKLYVEIVNDGQFAGGDTELTISEINYIFNGSTCTINITENNTVSVFINGALTVDSLSVARLADGQYEETYYGYYSEQLYYKINLQNATRYNITSITIGDATYDSADIDLSDDYQTAYVAMSEYWGYGWYSYTLNSISYSNTDETIKKTKTVDVSVAYMRLNCNSGEVVEISTADDLLNMDDWKYYKLVNNIDLLGLEWANINNNMYGVFDGNGYTISSMSAVTTSADSDLYLGLFKYVSGVVFDLKITDALYMITLNNDTGSDYYVYAGGIAAYANSDLVIDNCKVEFTVRLTNNNTSGATYIGGVIGNLNASYLTLNDIEVDSAMEITALNSISVGGIAGYLWCYENAAISGLDVNLTVKMSMSSYYGYNTNAYFGSYYYNGTFAIKNSTANYNYTVEYTDNDTVYYGISDFRFSYSDGEYSLVGYYGNDTDIVLPDSINGNSYAIGNGAFNNTTLTSITIGSGVTYINMFAFENSTAEIIWSENCAITEIGSYAFYNYKGATLTIPDSVTSIGSWAFAYCTADIVWGNNPSITEIGNSVFVNYSGASIIIPDSVTSIGSYAFDNCSAEIIWGNNPSITEIGSCAFGNYKGTSITIPDSITSISSSAFTNCTATIIWGDNPSITEIAEGAFNGYGGASITIPASVTTLDKFAFNGCSAEIIWADNSLITEIGGYAFYGYAGTSITIPDSVTTIGERAFAESTSLTSITIGSGVTTINYAAFYNCTAEIIWSDNSSITELGDSAFYGYKGTSITIPNSVTTICDSAFSECTATIVWGNNPSITEIGNYAFANYQGASITIPASVTSIGEWAFQNCTAEIIWAEDTAIKEISAYAFAWYAGTSLTIPDSVTSIKGNAFYSCTAESITIGSGVTTIGNYVFENCTSEIFWSENANLLKISDGAFWGYKGTSITIPNSVISIGNSAFNECTNLTSIVIPNSVISIGDNAFYNCSSLTSITIPSSVTSIGYNAFVGCSSLTSINVNGDNKNYKSVDGNLYSYDGKTLIQYATGKTDTSFEIPNTVITINSYAFYGCTALESIVIPDNVIYVNDYAFYNCTSLTSVVISDNVEYISWYSFYNCTSLTSVVIGSDVHSIYNGAFYNCSSLANIYYNGTEAEWNNIYIESDNEFIYMATVYYYSANKPTESGNYWHYNSLGEAEAWS